MWINYSNYSNSFLDIIIILLPFDYNYSFAYFASIA